MPPEVRSRIETKVDDLGLRLKWFPYHRLKGQDRYRLRVGDYRVIYTFAAAWGIIHLLGDGNRKDMYRDL